MSGAVMLGAGGFLLARRDDVVRWNTNRRSGERRAWERRAGPDRRSDLRLDHDERVNNANRRRAERREGERRQPTGWKDELESVRERIEEIQHDNRNR